MTANEPSWTAYLGRTDTGHEQGWSVLLVPTFGSGTTLNVDIGNDGLLRVTVIGTDDKEAFGVEVPMKQ